MDRRPAAEEAPDLGLHGTQALRLLIIRRIMAMQLLHDLVDQRLPSGARFLFVLSHLRSPVSAAAAVCKSQTRRSSLCNHKSSSGPFSFQLFLPLNNDDVTKPHHESWRDQLTNRILTVDRAPRTDETPSSPSGYSKEVEASRRLSPKPVSQNYLFSCQSDFIAWATITPVSSRNQGASPSSST